MTTLYKLTDADGYTRRGRDNECFWSEGATHSGTGEGGLCGRGYIHAYTDPLLAVLLNPTHANLQDPLLWECEGEIALSDNGLKVGCVSLTTMRRLPLPEVTTEQRVRFGILCAKRASRSSAWDRWADDWLSGADRSAAAAAEAEAATTWAAAAAAAWAAGQAEAETTMASAPAAAARAAVVAAEAARARGVGRFDLAALAKKAMGRTATKRSHPFVQGEYIATRCARCGCGPDHTNHKP